MIAVIGGGWAGCAAAVELARGGFRVVLHEASAVVGGRARSVVRDGLPLDNGEHLLLGAYVETRRLVALLHQGESQSPWIARPLAIRPFAPGQRHALTLRPRSLPAPLGMLIGVLDAVGLSWSERIATIRWFARQHRGGFRCRAESTVDELLNELPSGVRRALWEPLCLAALNTPPQRASAQIFLNVLREAFDGASDATTMLAPRHGLGEILPEHAARWLSARGHLVHRSSRVLLADTPDGVRLRHAAGESLAEAALVAVGPHQLASTFDGPPAMHDPRITAALRAVERFEFEPITTVYLGYEAAMSLSPGLVRLDDAPGQWIFDRADVLARATPPSERGTLRALLSVVISTRMEESGLDGRTLVKAVDAQLRRLKGDMPAPCWSQVIAEKRATYACVPGLARPKCGHLAGRIYLAGDYTYAGFPATLEAAVRSGVDAARALMDDRAAASAA